MDILPNEAVIDFKDFIDSHDNFFIIGHKDPDGDCVSSCLGVAAILEHFNKEFTLLSAGPFKRTELKNFENQFTNDMGFLDDNDRKKTGLIITDCAELSRLGEIEGDFSGLDIFVIDHHKTSGLPENAKGYINSEAPACAYLIQLFYEKLIGPLPPEVASIIFFGIGTDTGFFVFLNTSNESADILSAASRLVSYGANPRNIYNEINNGKPYSTRKLLGILLNRAEKYLDGKLIVTYETLDDTHKWGTEGRDSDALYKLLLAVDKVEAVAFVRQDTLTTCTCGLRSLDAVDVSEVASKFGGGGHKNASGLTTNGKVDTLIPALVKEFARIM
ncbi:MAG: bifunctional oligoribonuclease/PAP phosphatase NrnA [Treponema sp.]|nr:bifunctional oligoribonuclease/PAP phosphatase NrnA [Treponema sp.]